MTRAPEPKPRPPVRRARTGGEVSAEGGPAAGGDSSDHLRDDERAASGTQPAREAYDGPTASSKADESPCAEAPPADGAPPSSERRPASRGCRDGAASGKRRLTREEADAAEVPVRALLDLGEHRAAIERLMAVYGEELYGYCYRLTGRDEALAEDALQDAYVRAYRGLGQVRPGTHLRSWLHSIAHHRAVDLLRAQGARPWEAAAASPDEVAVEGPGAEASMDLRRAQRQLGAFVAELPAEEQDLLALRYGQGLSYEEMGALRNKKAGTLQARVARALAKLQGRFRKGK
jgi:RNA polymerase sigma-70 factor (ECF subfamily)